MSVAIIDYGSGNLRSVAKAFERVGASVFLTSNPQDLAKASHIVLPGVGAFADCMNGLKALPGMLDALEKQVIEVKKPFLGICVGMQMLFEKGHEHGVCNGLGWLQGEVQALVPAQSLKIPHMGWNDLLVRGSHALLHTIKNGDHAYFVHSYHAVCSNPDDVWATVNYGQTVVAVVGHDNIMGVQFHPEKSQETGLMLIKNFLALS
jgi:imidazole glycerol-phosphate synthase subunit HisH